MSVLRYQLRIPVLRCLTSYGYGGPGRDTDGSSWGTLFLATVERGRSTISVQRTRHRKRARGVRRWGGVGSSQVQTSFFPQNHVYTSVLRPNGPKKKRSPSRSSEPLSTRDRSGKVSYRFVTSSLPLSTSL